jgi:hypothetical protein
MVAIWPCRVTLSWRSRCLRAALSLGVIALGGLLNGVAAAGEQSKDSPWQIPRAKPPWFDVAFDDEHTTGTCIGRLVSPRCAIETTYACLIRGGELCRRVLLRATSIKRFEVGRSPNEITRYRVARTQNTRPKIWPDSHDHADDETAWRSGDLAVIVDNSHCYLPGPVCWRPPPDTTVFAVRRIGVDWRVLRWETLPAGPGFSPSLFLD